MRSSLACILLSALTLGLCAAELPGPVVPQCFGVNIHFTRAPEAELDKLADIGFKFVRMDMSWSSIERKKGEYNFEPYDGLVELMSKRGIRIVFILDYANRLYDNGVGPNSDEGVAAFAKACAAAVKHFSGRHILWEIWNEPNIDEFFKPHADAEAYSKIANAAVDAIRIADPAATVIGPASSTFPWEFYDVMIKRGAMQKFDAISVHPYRQNDPETAAKDYQRLRLTLARAGIDKPLLSGEWGYSTGWKNLPEDTQARYLVRQWLINLANDVHLSIWYDWKDDGDDPKEPEHHFGSVHRDLKDKPASQAAKVLCDTLGGYRYMRRLAEGSDRDFLLVFAKDNDIAIAAWTTGDPSTVPLSLRHPQSVTIDARSMDGTVNKLEFDKEEMKWLLKLTHAPQYIRIKGMKIASWGPRPQTLVVGRRAPARWDVGEPLFANGPEYMIRRDGTDPTIATTKSHAISLEPAVSWEQLPADQERVSATMHRSGYTHDPLDSARVSILNPDAIIVDLLPGSIAHLSNPSGRAFMGKLRADGPATVDVNLKEGQNECSLALPNGTTGKVRLLNVAGSVLAEVGPAAWHAVKLDGAFGAWTEGDAKITGSAAAELVDVPEPPVPGLGKAVKITYRLGNGWRYAVASPKANAIDFEAKELGMWLYGDGSRNKLVCRVADKTGQVFQTSYGAITWTGWRWVTMRFDGDDVFHFAGANDGVMHYPIKLHSMVLLDNAKREVDRDLTVYVAGAALR